MNSNPFFLLSFLIITATLFSSCEESMTPEEVAKIGIEQCRMPAKFIKDKGFDYSRCAFSTTSTQKKGLVLLEMPKNSLDTVKQWQHPSWNKFGWLGSITTDASGNAFVAPIPVVNTFDNPTSTINKFFKVDQATGEMKLFCTLPKADSTDGIVPFGVLGLYYDCHGKVIYAASVAGSTRDDEKGVIYVVNSETGEVEDQLKGYDAIGVCVGGITGTKKLYFGSARTSDIYSIELYKNGHFKGKPQIEFSIDQLGPRGDDKARRIRFDSKGNMNIFGVSFNFSLAAQSDVQEQTYKFTYNSSSQKWEYQK